MLGLVVVITRLSLAITVRKVPMFLLVVSSSKMTLVMV